MTYTLHDWRCVINLILIVDMSIIKMFTFIRIFEKFSPIVTMLKIVSKSLIIFLIFFLILVFQFSLKFAIIGLGNMNIEGEYRDHYFEDV